MPDTPANSSTNVTISVNGVVNDQLETVGDHDWIRVTLTAGVEYGISVVGGTLGDPLVQLLNQSGTMLFQNDDGAGSLDALLSFRAPYTGTYYIDVSSAPNNETGTYQVSLTPYQLPPVGTLDEIADQLISGYWNGDVHHFDAAQGDSITVNLTGLTSISRAVALEALQTWTDIIGVTFVEVTGAAQITFDDIDQGTGAFSNSQWTNGLTDWATVNVSAARLGTGTGVFRTGLWTYLHEIAHALGLGHAGNYNNGTANSRFPYEALWINDGAALSIMSYFDNGESTYYSGLGFSNALIVTPQLADIIAIGNLYGLSTTTRLGDTVYGFNNNTGREMYNAFLHPTLAYTVFDSGGNDTLDYSGFGMSLRIDLNPESFSNIGGLAGNVAIARDTWIENAIGGAGNDTIIGNAIDNVLTGNGGADQMFGGAGDDLFFGGAGNDLLDGQSGVDTASYADAAAAVTINLGEGTAASSVGTLAGIGADTLVRVEHVIGSAFDDTIHGDSADNVLDGGDGDDHLNGLSGNDWLNGGAGVDLMAGGVGDDHYVVVDYGDSVLENDLEGYDTVFASISYTLTPDVEALSLTGDANIFGRGNGVDNLIIGNGSGNKLYGLDGEDRLYGGDGNDLLDGGEGSVDRMWGGEGDDVYFVRDASDYAFEVAGEGTDLVYSSISYSLRAEVENLTLSGTAVLGRGNASDNLVNGNAAANRLYGLAGDDRLYGRDGNDILDGGAGGLDRMWGGTGDDVYYVRDATDYAFEYAGEGADQVYATVSHILRANIEKLRLLGTDDIFGKGNAGDNVITGNSAANKLFGLGGDDRIDGGAGNDLLFGGAGRDVMSGGAGADLFIFDDGDFGGANAANADRILDFSQASGDRIRLSAVDANSSLGGDQGFAFIGTAAFSATAGELRYQQLGSNTFVMGDIDGDGTADFWIWIDGLHSLGASDFFL